MHTTQTKTERKATATGGHLFFAPVQAKLTVNQPNDVYEQEADSVAEKVMRMTDHSTKSSPFFQPAYTGIQRKDSSNSESEAPDQLTDYVGGLNSKGAAMSGQTKKFFESRMGHDFSNVKIHTDDLAARSAQSINALAYTSGNNIVFNQNQYQPATNAGKRLIAHELTHVVQQSSHIQPYRSKKAFNFGKNDTATLIEESFSYKKDKETKPWIETILLTLDKTITDVNGFTTYTGTGKASYYNNAVKLPDISFTATAGSEDLGMTSAGSFKVTRIEGIGYNSGKYSGKVDKKNREGPNKRYSKDLSANMSYAVFFHGGEALHQGPLDWSSHGCVHVDWATNEMQQINYHSIIGITKVEVKYK
jgi:hypothetical protein